ncbi:MAG: VWA-like domain-containing protein, partial [Eubacteriales bacterium]|nr:VWA-like domain-containing protein [Eubacteriales bacterium]
NRWETVTKHIRMEQMIHEKKFGEAWGSLVQNIEEVRKDPIDYKQFLMDFAAFGEEMHVNHDEFDYIYYNYGMDLYGNIPLIEPLEYSSEKRVREFAIVLDTSGSCTGEVVQSFLEKTYSVLMTEETFSNKVNIHIIQSDTAIQQDYKIRSVEEMDEFLRTQKLTGFGGTDFRPAFAYIDELIENKEFENLKGILYFTDGYGTYPAEIPDYKTAFVFVDTGTVTPNVPSWAMKVVLEEERLRKEKS